MTVITSQSERQMKYLRKQKKKKRTIQIARVLLLLAFLLLWEITSRLEIIDSFFFSSPSKLWNCFLSMITEQALFTHIGISLLETLYSFLFIMLINAVLNYFLKGEKK